MAIHTMQEKVAELRKRNCETLVCDLPAVDGVNGPDDYIAVCGDDAMAQVFANAEGEADRSAEFSDDALALRFTLWARCPAKSSVHN